MCVCVFVSVHERVCVYVCVFVRISIVVRLCLTRLVSAMCSSSLCECVHVSECVCLCACVCVPECECVCFPVCVCTVGRDPMKLKFSGDFPDQRCPDVNCKTTPSALLSPVLVGFHTHAHTPCNLLFLTLAHTLYQRSTQTHPYCNPQQSFLI